MPRTVFAGTLDAEKFWRDEHYAKLPEFPDDSALNIVAAMDELLFPLCAPGDILITRFAMKTAFKDFLDSIGFSFASNTKDLADIAGYMNHPDERSIFELLLQHRADPDLAELLAGASFISPYAVLPHTTAACRGLSLADHFPPIEVVQKVNSKVYSTELHDRIGIKKSGMVVNSIAELEVAATRLNGERGFLIKDPYGVSGKGNILISSPGILKRIEKHLASQEEKGLRICFVIEPYLAKKIDFSCQMKIDPTGNSRVQSVQLIQNRDLSYLGSVSAEAGFIEFLERRGYFEITAQVAAELAKEGYFGDVCIDSMVLTNDEIVPVIEINARKSMGLINQHLDQFLAPFGVRGFFVFYSVGFKHAVDFEQLLARFEAEGILFSPGDGSGVIPLSGNTLFINQDAAPSPDNEKISKGRFYFSAVAGTLEARLALADKVKDILKSWSFYIYN